MQPVGAIHGVADAAEDVAAVGCLGVPGAAGRQLGGGLQVVKAHGDGGGAEVNGGAYEVAEKYIKLLERTLAYRDWAKERRRFLYNDKAVRADKVLGMKRKCIFSDDKLMGNGGFDNDLASIVKACPEHRATLEYLGAMYIVANQRSKFLALMKQYMGTKAMPHIPASFAKAMEVFCKNPE